MIYNGVNLDRFIVDSHQQKRVSIRKKHMISNEEFLILFVGTDVKRKGLYILLHALDRAFARMYNIRLCVIGKPHSQSHRVIQQQGLDTRVIFVSSVDDIQHYYAAADCLCLPTWYDPFANVCLEALACGLPVLTTYTNGASELIVDGLNGFIIKEITPGGVRHALLKILRYSARTQLSVCARKTAEQHSLESSVRQTEAFFKETAGIHE